MQPPIQTIYVPSDQVDYYVTGVYWPKEKTTLDLPGAPEHFEIFMVSVAPHGCRCRLGTLASDWDDKMQSYLAEEALLQVQAEVV